MTKKYLYYFFLILSVQKVFGYTKTNPTNKIPEAEKKSIIGNRRFPSGWFDKLPKEFKEKQFKEKTSYGEMDSSMRHLITRLWARNTNNADSFNYTKKSLSSSDKNYIIIKFFQEKLIYYIFEWIKKLYPSRNVSGLEEFIAEYYQVSDTDNLQFLYPYGESSSDEPWGIKINDKIHTFLWKKLSINDLKNNNVNPSLSVKPEEEHFTTFLIAEDNNVLAKKTNGILSYNRKSY